MSKDKTPPPRKNIPQKAPPPLAPRKNIPLSEYIQKRVKSRDPLSEIEKLYIAKQIAEITKKYHEEEKANFDYKAKRFKIKLAENSSLIMPLIEPADSFSSKMMDISRKREGHLKRILIDEDVSKMKVFFDVIGLKEISGENANDIVAEIEKKIAKIEGRQWEEFESLKQISKPEIILDPEIKEEISRSSEALSIKSDKEFSEVESTPRDQEEIFQNQRQLLENMDDISIEILCQRDSRGYLYITEDQRFEIAASLLDSAAGKDFITSDIYVKVRNGKVAPTEIEIKEGLKESDDDEMWEHDSEDDVFEEGGLRALNPDRVQNVLKELGVFDINLDELDEKAKNFREVREAAEREEEARRIEISPQVQIEMEVDQEQDQEERADVVAPTFGQSQIQLTPIDSPLLSAEMQKYRDNIFDYVLKNMRSVAFQSDTLKENLRRINDLNLHLESMEQPTPSVLNEFNDLKKALENDPKYWVQAQIIMNHNEGGESEKAKDLRYLVQLHKMIQEYNELIREPNLNSKETRGKFEALCNKIIGIYDSIPESRKNDLNASAMPGPLEQAMAGINQMKRAAENNKSVSRNVPVRVLHSLREALTSFRSFVMSRIRTLSDRLTGDDKKFR